MAQLQTTKEMLVALDHIIRNAEKFICIFTFNIQIDENFMARLRNAAKRGVNITVVFGVESGKPEVVNAIQALENCTVYFKPYLHAKFYYNEKALLVGSMNMSEASSIRNFELGVLFEGDSYKQVITKVKSEAREIINDAYKWEDRAQYVNSSRNQGSFAAEPAAKYAANKKDAPTKSGHCIRCNSSIPFDISRPLCGGCYWEWQQWENEFYEENYDHLTGEKSQGATCFAKPILHKNWKREFEVIGLPF